MLEAALEFWNAIKGKVADTVKEKTRNALRIERYDVTTAPNGSVVGVTQPFGSKELFIPYSREVASAKVGDTVLVVWWNALSTAKAYYFGGGYDGGYGHYLGTNPIASTNDDTVAKWTTLGPGWAWYNHEDYLLGQPSKWGFLFNYVYDINSSDVFQVWHEQSNGPIWYRSGNGNTTWSSTSWTKVATSSEIPSVPVTSVNGMTGDVWVMSTSAPSDTSTAAQCLAYAQSHPNVMYVWAKYSAATYTPVQSAGHWFYTLYTTYTLDATYTSFQALDTDSGDIWVCKNDGKWVCHMEPERTNANLSAGVAVANQTWTTLTTISLPGPGLYYIKALASFPSNAVGRRQIVLSNASGTSGVTRYYGDTRMAVDGTSTVCEFSGLTRVSAATTYYLKAWQNSGGSLTVSQYSGVDALRFDKRSSS